LELSTELLLKELKRLGSEALEEETGRLIHYTEESRLILLRILSGIRPSLYLMKLSNITCHQLDQKQEERLGVLRKTSLTE
jgi:hypothetical protein